MVRPDGTPRRPSPDSQGEQPPAAKRPAIEPRVLNTAAPTAAPTASATSATMADASSAGPSGGSDPAGNNAMWMCQSHPAQYQETPNGLKVTFGGSRLMYTWALDMRSHAVSYFGDFVPVGHSIPWDWIPFYCTPGEWATLPWKTHEMKIKRVGVSVTPVGKEVQFATASGTSTIASNEHLAVGYRAVGLNFRKDIPAYGLRRVKNNETTSSLITNTSDYIDYIDLRKRYWGDCSDFTLNTDPVRYGTSAQLSTAEMSIRENEIVGGIYVNNFDKAIKANNKATFGSVLLDRYVTRFPLMPAMGQPIIQETYEPKFGHINVQPHRILMQKLRNMNFKGAGNVAVQQWNSSLDGTINNKVSGISTSGDVSRNANIGSAEISQLGSYHGQIEKQRIQPLGGYTADLPTGAGQKSINFGMCPIRLINIASSAPEYVNARVVWKIDYFMEIECSFMKPSHCYATNISADGTVYPPHMYTDPIPRLYFGPQSWDTTNTDQPAKEEDFEGHMFQRAGHQFTAAPGVSGTAPTVETLMGAGATASWTASTKGLLEI